MVISKRKYYRNFLLTMLITGVVLLFAASVVDKYVLHTYVVGRICRKMLVMIILAICACVIMTLLKNRGIKNYVSKRILIKSIEENLISIGAYTKIENKNFVMLPKIKIRDNKIIIELSNLRIRNILDRYMNSFSTALPERYVVEDYYVTKNNAQIVISYEDVKNFKPEKYDLMEYRKLIENTDKMDLYFDRKHVVNLNDHPHILLSGSSGSGKSYLANELVIQAIFKQYEVVILDIKRSYGLYKDHAEYYYETDTILQKIRDIENEMSERMEKLQPELDKNPHVLAVDIGYRPKLIVIEEYISLLSSMDKKQKEEMERIVKNISVLARQSNIHMLMVMQSAGTENINSTTRSNMTKILMGRAQSNILNATFGNSGVDIPTTQLNKGEGLIQLDRITVIRVPEIMDIENFNKMI